MTAHQQHLSHPKYRPDIDGLRAIAVLAVVLFHAFPSAMKGGFIGVDIFFVISGYLISTIIFENLEKGTFQFSEFYARRIKRIFPALLFVLSACFVFGWFSLLADEFKQLGRHIAAGAGFVSNLVLWDESGYFDNSAETKPLLHLWSLGIEEQFYIFWPLLLWFFWKRKFNFLTITLILSVVSFILNFNGIKQDIVATFFSPQTRFWELLSGSLLAWGMLYKRDAFVSILNKIDGCLHSVIYSEKKEIDGNTLSNVLSFSGLFLLVYGLWKINKDLKFPGEWALVPVLGAMLIIAAGAKAWVNRTLLSNKFVVWFGLISFPLYLWHWPLLSFARIVEGEEPSQSIQFAAVTLSIVLAWVTYRFVELPIRFGKIGKIGVVLLVLLMVIVGYVGYNAYSRDGLIFRFNRFSAESRIAVLKIADAWRFRSYPLPDYTFKDPKYGFLRIGHNEQYKILFIGDSHTEQYWNSFKTLIDSSDVPNKPSVMFQDLGFSPYISDDLINDPSIKVVVFSYYWAYKYGSDKVDQAVRCCANGRNGSVGTIGPVIPHSNNEQRDVVDAMFETISIKFRNKNKRVYFVLDNPFGQENDPHAMLSRSWNGFSLVKRAALTREIAIERSEPIRSRIIAIANRSKAEIIDPIQYLCDSNSCPAFSSEGDLLYKDYDHLSLYASKFKTSYLAPVFKN